jgi:hypothetical protein
MKTILNTIVLALVLSTTAFAQTQEVSCASVGRVVATTACNCQVKEKTQTQKMQEFFQVMQSGQLSAPGIVIETAGQPTT